MSDTDKSGATDNKAAKPARKILRLFDFKDLSCLSGQEKRASSDTANVSDARESIPGL